MPPFSVPTPCIIPLDIPFCRESKNINTKTKIELLCDTDLQGIEIFYTLDGTKPQPYVGIVQGSKTFKYSSPFCLSAGKVTIKAVALHALLRSMCSSVITKCFTVDDTGPPSDRIKTKKFKKKKVSTPLLKDDPRCSTYIREDADKNKLFDAFNEESIINGAANEIVEKEPEWGLSAINRQDSDDDFESLVNDCDSVIECIEELPYNDVNENITPANSVRSVEANGDAERSGLHVCCGKCEMPLQHCFSCNKVSNIFSKFCDKCGVKLMQECVQCKESNPCIATYCQYCGKKISEKSARHAQSSVTTVDRCTMVECKTKDIGLQKTPLCAHKYVQTISPRNSKTATPQLKNLPKNSPGRGFWHQQLDYICNHLKGHAYNNLEFRKLIGEPCLHEFLSADILKDENSITVQIVFSSLMLHQECDMSIKQEK